MDQAVEEGSGGDNHRLAQEGLLIRLHPDHPVAFKQQLLYQPLGNRQVLLSLQHPAHCVLIFVHFGLTPRAPSGRTPGSIEHPKLDSGGIGNLRHLTSERVNLLYQVPLADSANRRIAGHLGDGFSGHRDQHRPDSHACCSEGGFASGVSGTNHQHVKFGGTLRHLILAEVSGAETANLCCNACRAGEAVLVPVSKNLGGLRLTRKNSILAFFHKIHYGSPQLFSSARLAMDPEAPERAPARRPPVFPGGAAPS